ncbi:MAG TPA: hypothetical protein VFI11_09555, partial [Anaerolineales bacterium]|nr:hypothetical protein [Anaerolineales bacterium]
MRFLSVLLFALLTAACSALNPPTVDAGGVATRVAGTLTAQAPTPGPPQLPTLTAPLPATVSPTATVPTETLAASPTATATTTPTSGPTPTSVSGDPRTTLGDPDWRDQFANDNNWPTGEDSFTEAEIEDDRMALEGKTSSDGWRVTFPEIDDFYLEGTFRTGTCSGNDHYGLMFRIPDRHDADEGYLLGLTCDGRFWLRIWDGENMETIVPLTANSAIVQGSNQTNRLGIWAEGDRFKLYANGKLLTETTHDALDEGAFGVFVGARKTDNFTVYITEVAYWNLD